MKETVVGKAMGTFLSVTSYEGKAQEADALVRSIFHQVEMTASGSFCQYITALPFVAF